MVFPCSRIRCRVLVATREDREDSGEGFGGDMDGSLREDRFRWAIICFEYDSAAGTITQTIPEMVPVHQKSDEPSAAEAR